MLNCVWLSVTPWAVGGGRTYQTVQLSSGSPKCHTAQWKKNHIWAKCWGLKSCDLGHLNFLDLSFHKSKLEAIISSTRQASVRGLNFHIMQSTCHWKQPVWPLWCLPAEPTSPPQLPTASDLHTAVVVFPVSLPVTNPCVLNFEFKFTVKDLARGGGSLIN